MATTVEILEHTNYDEWKVDIKYYHDNYFIEDFQYEIGEIGVKDNFGNSATSSFENKIISYIVYDPEKEPNKPSSTEAVVTEDEEELETEESTTETEITVDLETQNFY
jgi:hypothetical protein